MSYQKNDVLTVKIEDMGHDGEGIGKCEGYTLFVKDTVIGDLAEVKVIKAKKNYGYARLMRLIEPSPHRVEPICPVARPCGGCQLQMLDYAEQLRFKEKKIAQNLQRIGGMTEIPMEPIVGMESPFRYRNKAQFPIGQDKNGKLITGFYAGRTHQIMENRNCYLGVEQNEEILNRILAWMEENSVSAYQEETGKGLVRHVLIRFGFTTKEIMVCLVVNGKKLPAEKKLIQSLTELEGMTSITLSVNRERTNVIMGKEIRCLWGQEFITDYIGKVKYQISPLSFYQVNPVQTEKLYSLALEYAGLTGEETVWDLYCGIGTISLFSGAEGEKSLRRGDRAGGHRRCEKQCENQWNRKCRVFCRKIRGSTAGILRKICQRTSRRTCACRCDCSRSAAERMRGKSAPHHGRYAAGSDCVCLVRFCDTGKGSEDSSGAGV